MEKPPALLPLPQYRFANHSDHERRNKHKTSTSIANTRSSILKWWPEATAWVVSVAIVAAIIVVLQTNNGVATIQWQSQFPITLNAFLSLLNTFLYMALMVPIPKCIAQLKWNHYTAPRPLSDVEIFDEASRTVWGSAVLLAKRPNRILAALGAILTLMVAGVGPFVQQILTQEVVPRQIEGALPTVPIFNWTSSYSGATTMAAWPNQSQIRMEGIFEPDFDTDAFDAAFYAGLIASESRDFPVAPDCVAANCTWDPYWTLVIESECHNITNQLHKSNDSWYLPNGIKIARESHSITTSPSVVFQDRGNLLLDFFFTASEVRSPATALECILQLRARKVQAEYKNGQWTETQVGRSVADDSLQARACSPWRRQLAGGNLDLLVNMTDATGETYPNTTRQDPLSDLWYARGRPWDNFTYSCNVTIPTTSSETYSGPTLVFPGLHLLTPAYRLQELLGRDASGIQTFWGVTTRGIFKYLDNLVSFDPQQQFLLDQKYNITFVERVDNIAKSLTQAFRSSYFRGSIIASGLAYKDSVVYRVEWYWVTVPVSLVVLTSLLLVLTIWDTFHKGLQKRTDSSIALMVFGCDEQMRSRLALAHDVDAMTRAAKKQFVILGDDHGLTSVDHTQAWKGVRQRKADGL